MQKTLFLLAACWLSCFISFTQTSPLYELEVVSDLLYVEEASVKDASLQRLNLVLPKGKVSAPLLIYHMPAFGRTCRLKQPASTGHSSSILLKNEVARPNSRYKIKMEHAPA